MFPASWSSLGVQQLFDANSTNSPQPVPDSSTKASASHLSGGQITGIAVGGTFAIALVIAAWFVLIHRRRKRATVEPVESTIEAKPSVSDISPTSRELDSSDYKYELPEPRWIGNEVRGDLGGTEVYGDLAAFELSTSDSTTKKQ